MFDVKYTDIQEQIQFDILNGVYGGVRSKLPSFRKLAGRYDVSLVTISKAMNSLKEADIIDIRGTRGAFVKKNIKARERFNNIAVINNFLGDDPGVHANQVLDRCVRKHDLGLFAMSIARVSNYEPELYTSLRADGFIFMHSTLNRETAQALAKVNIPFVSLNKIDEDYISWIDYDNDADFEMVMKYFLDAGHRRIAVVNFSDTFAGEEMNYNAYFRIMTDAGVFNPDYFIARDSKPGMRSQFGPEFYKEAGKRMAGYLLNLPELPEAVFINNGITYKYIREECARNGVDIQREAEIVVNIEDSQDFNEGTHVLLAPFKEKVEKSFNILHEFIDKKQISPVHTLIPHKFIKAN